MVKARRRNGKRIKRPGKVRYFDYGFLGMVFVLLAFGLVMLYSSSAYFAATHYGNPTYFLKRQMGMAIVGLIVMAVAAYFPYQLLLKWDKAIYLVTILLCFLVLIIGHEANGQARWIPLGPIRFQPSELAKPAVAVAISSWITKRRDKLFRLEHMGVGIAITGFMALPIVLNNLSTAVIVAGIGIAMMFVATKRKRELVCVTLALGGLAYLATKLKGGYRSSRITNWLHPELASDDEGYQVLQGLYAIGSGGPFGKGLGSSVQKLGKIPEVQNDMIFTVIVEELGVFGAVCVVIMFLILLWRMMFIAIHARDMFGSFVVIGIMVHVSLQVIFNIAVASNTIPNTGVTLPFISYGGTSLIILLAEMGIVLSVSRQIPLDQPEL
ncbi:MAG: putative lipid II flippase FtsW [Lachnospiraceae bacterium]|nr:putative lipid II flippase FtsW [Lachnospiraceae bacterium]